jgi:hypothetical protein
MASLTEVLPVVQGSLEPLHAAGHQSVLLQDHQMPSQRTSTLGSHGVPLHREPEKRSENDISGMIRREAHIE